MVPSAIYGQLVPPTTSGIHARLRTPRRSRPSPYAATRDRCARARAQSGGLRRSPPQESRTSLSSEAALEALIAAASWCALPVSHAHAANVTNLSSACVARAPLSGRARPTPEHSRGGGYVAGRSRGIDPRATDYPISISAGIPSRPIARRCRKCERSARPQRWLGRVADAVLGAVAPHDLGDLRVVRVRHVREQVVLDLEVEAAEHPGQHGLRGQKSTVVSTSWTAQTRRWRAAARPRRMWPPRHSGRAERSSP